MKIWLDGKNPAPKGYMWATCVNDAIKFIEDKETYLYVCHMPIENAVEEISLPPSGYARDDMLNFLEETGRKYPITTHEDVGPAELYRRHKAKKENHFKDVADRKNIDETNKEKILKEVYRHDGGEWTLVISV